MNFFKIIRLIVYGCFFEGKSVFLIAGMILLHVFMWSRNKIHVSCDRYEVLFPFSTFWIALID